MISALVFMLISTVIGVVNASVSGAARAKLAPVANQLAKQISNDTKLRDDLIEAYNNKDLKLANQILSSSPFSSNYHRLLDIKNQMDRDYKQYKDALDRKINDTTAKYDDVQNNISNSDGVIGGSIALDKLNKGQFVPTTDSDKIQQLVKGGVSSFSNIANTGLGAIIKPQGGK